MLIICTLSTLWIGREGEREHTVIGYKLLVVFFGSSLDHIISHLLFSDIVEEGRAEDKEVGHLAE